jgi:alpha-tubulin suppressor-like RCC1 family protein
MADRFPGGVISKTPPTVVGPVDGEGGSASGVWTLDEQLGLQKAGNWPKPPLPRELYAWGDNSPNGQLGDGTVIDKSSPVQVGALANWSQVAAGTSHTAAITQGGKIYAWGDNSPDGRLGDGTVVDRSSPVQIGALTNWSQVAAGNFHTACVKTDGTLFIWGRNYEGQLGDGTVIDRSSPVQVGALTSWAQVSAGGQHTAAIKTDGTLWTWGYNNAGQLGDGTVIRRSSPVQIGALTNWSQVSAGNRHTASVTTGGELYAWGYNNRGQLGDGTVIDKSSPVQVGALTNWSQVAVGATHTACVKTDGTLFTWGLNSSGQLGHGDAGFPATLRSSPVQVGALTDWAQVAAGSSHTACAKTDGTLWAWGNNSPNGQLGDGTIINKSSPVQVGALTNWAQVAAGANHTLATTRG